MKAAVFGSKRDFEEISEFLRTIRSDAIPETCIRHFEDYDDMREILPSKEYQLAIILENGAKGMEVCIGTRKIRPDIPMFWFSDDPNFGPQSYRLDCTYFSVKPLTEARLLSALEIYREHRMIEGLSESPPDVFHQSS